MRIRDWSSDVCSSDLGDTRVLCTASVETSLPPWLRGKGKGWVTAEYGMLPRATHTRGRREAASGKQSGRTQEIQRLIDRKSGVWGTRVAQRVYLGARRNFKKQKKQQK